MNYSHRRRSTAKRVAFLGLLFSLAMVFSLLEGMIPTAGWLPPGVKLGLANIVTLFALFYLSVRQAVCITLLKSLFVLLLRGGISGAVSLAGGMLSLVAMAVLLKAGRGKLHPLLVSIVGAVMHNVGQLCMVSVLLQSQFAWYYLPVLLLAGMGMGILTGLIFRVLSPYLEHLQIKVSIK